MRFATKNILGFLVLTCVAACGAETSESSDEVGVNLQKFRVAACEWTQRCDGQPNGEAECQELEPPWDQPLFRPGLVDEMAACFTTLSCESNNDVCGDSILVREAENATGARKESIESCEARYETCGYESYECAILSAMVEPALEDYDTCFLLSECAEMTACLNPLGFSAEPDIN